MAHRLVRIAVHEDGEPRGKFLGYAWGLLRDTNEEEFFPLYTRSKRAAQDLVEKDQLPQTWIDLSDHEIDCALDVDECWTPSVVYTEVAKRALTGGI